MECNGDVPFLPGTIESTIELVDDDCETPKEDEVPPGGEAEAPRSELQVNVEMFQPDSKKAILRDHRQWRKKVASTQSRISQCIPGSRS